MFNSFFGVSRKDILIAVFAVVLFMAFIPVFTYAYFAKDLSTSETIMNRNDTGVVLLDREGEPFYTFYQAKNKTTVPLSVIPKHTQQAIIAMEDKNFYNHEGFSIPAMVRSLYMDVTSRDLAYGGSTITQQLVKNSLLTPRKNFLRKYQELVLAQEIERRYPKDEILAMYLNSVLFKFRLFWRG
jgi:penicillin-binding protein 2A